MNEGDDQSPTRQFNDSEQHYLCIIRSSARASILSWSLTQLKGGPRSPVAFIASSAKLHSIRPRVYFDWDHPPVDCTWLRGVIKVRARQISIYRWKAVCIGHMHMRHRDNDVRGRPPLHRAMFAPMGAACGDTFRLSQSEQVNSDDPVPTHITVIIKFSFKLRMNTNLLDSLQSLVCVCVVL